MFDLKLWQKGLILVAIPLLCELLFVASLTYLLKQAEVEIWRERHAKAVVAECDRLVKNFVDAGVLFLLYRVTKSDTILARQEEIANEIPEEFHSLTVMLRDSPHQQESIEKFQTASSRALELMNRERSLADQEKAGIAGRSGSAEFAAMSSQLIAGLRQFVKEQVTIEETNPQDEARTRLLIVQCLVGGVILNIVIAVMLAILFNQGTARRLALLMDNTKRLARREQLNPPMSGSDEIAHLDHVFHDMSSELADAAQRKQELMNMVTHDLRSPLTSLQATLTLFSEGIMGELNPKAQRKIEVAERSVGRLINLINDLLDIEKLESGMLSVQCENIELQPVLARSVDAVNALADQQKLKIDVADCNLQVLGDADRLVQVLINLLSNAIKYSPEESAISVQTEKIDSMAEVRVTDQGQGIPPEFHEKIFERFQQVNPGDARERKGTGLGLPICKALIVAHGGTIGVRSEPGKGSTFWFRIPLAKAGG